MKNLGLKIGYGLFLSVFLILMGVARPTWCYDGPDDPKAIAAADAAINALGPDHGAIDITGKVVGITGFQALEVTGTKGRIKGVSKDIEKVLTDLGAKKVGQKIQVSLSGDVLFDFDKWDVKEAAEKTLYKLVKAIKGLKVKEILIEGHTDAKGSEEYNLALSQRRADSVKAWLIEKGSLSGTSIVTKGYGESKPVVPNTHPDGSDNPAGRAKNRRVEIYVTLLGD